MVDLSQDQINEILRRGVEAQAFINSPLFVLLTEWIKQEESLMGVAIALDRRDKAQERLTREQFVEQMSGYYRGIQTYHSLFNGFISKANELQKQITMIEEQKKEGGKQSAEMDKLKKKAYGNESNRR